MPVNVGLAQLSDHFLLATVFFYAFAVLAYAGDFAFGRRGAGRTAGQAQAAPVAEKAKVAVGAGIAAQIAATAPETAAPAALTGSAGDAADAVVQAAPPMALGRRWPRRAAGARAGRPPGRGSGPRSP